MRVIGSRTGLPACRDFGSVVGNATSVRSASFGKHSIGEAGDRVLFMDGERPADERRHHSAGKCDVAAHPEHDVGTMRADRSQALPERHKQIER